MGHSFVIDYDIRYYETDINGNLLLSRMLNLFDNSAVVQSENLGVGIDYLASVNKSWYLYQWDVIVNRLPSFGEVVFVETKPEDFYNFYATRSYKMVDKEGFILASGFSLWIFLDIKKKRPTPIPDELIQKYGCDENKKERLRPVEVGEPSSISYEKNFSAIFSHLDTNMHVNQGVYIDWLLSSLPLDFLKLNMPERLKLTYKKEVFADQKVKVSTEEKFPFTFHRVSLDEKNEVVVIAEIKWRPRN